MAMAWIASVALVIHIFLSWLFILKLGWGFPGAAITLNLAWVIVDVGQLIYIMSGAFPGSWTGMSRLAFQDFPTFIRLSLASVVMLWFVFFYHLLLCSLVLLFSSLKSCKSTRSDLVLSN